MFQAVQHSAPGNHYRIDCLPCVAAVHNGRKWATAAHRPLARVMGLFFTAADDTSPERFVWMPAHRRAVDVGVAELGNGDLNTAADLARNELVDVAAKAGVEEHRVPEAIRKRLDEHEELVHGAAVWLGQATHLANEQHGWAARDSLASRARAGMPRPRRGSRQDRAGPGAAA